MTLPNNPSEIPPITFLRQKLDYNNPNLPRCKLLHNSMQYFRSSFVSSKGLDGSSLIDWKVTKQQAALTEMTNAFLERDGKGHHFWPDDETSDRFNRLKYSTDHALIKQTIRQLFWRMNLQHFRNSKYRKNRDNKDSTAVEDTAAGRGLSHDNPIEVDPVSDGDPSHNGGEIPESRRSVTVASFTAQHGAADKGVLQLASNDPRPRATGSREASKDPYRVPESPEINGEVPTIRKQNPKTRSLAPYANMGPLTQRPGTNDNTSVLTKSSSRGRKRLAVVHSSRASPRKRKQRKQSPYVSWVEVPGPATSDDVEFAEGDTAPGGDAPRNSLDPPAPPMPSVEDVIDEEFADPSTDEARMQATEAAFELIKDTPAASSRPTPRGTPAREPTETRSTVATLTDKTAPAVIVESERKRQDESAHATSAMQKGPSQTPQVEITYQIITWYPEHLSRPWIPKGSFRSKTLSELQEEIPVNLGDSHVTGLQFLVKAPGINAEYHVPNGRDEKFNRMKANLELAIRNGIAKAVKDGRPLLDIEITIEVLTDMDSTNRLDDLEFEW